MYKITNRTGTDQFVGHLKIHQGEQTVESLSESEIQLIRLLQGVYVEDCGDASAKVDDQSAQELLGPPPPPAPKEPEPYDESKEDSQDSEDPNLVSVEDLLTMHHNRARALIRRMTDIGLLSEIAEKSSKDYLVAEAQNRAEELSSDRQEPDHSADLYR